MITASFGTVASQYAYSSFAPWRMIPPHSCAVPGRKPGHVDERDERDVERVAGAHETRRLHGRVDVEHAGERLRLVADDPDGVAAEPREPADDVLGEALVHLEKLAFVDDAPDDVLHVVRLVRIVGDQRVELGVLAVDRRRTAPRTAADRGCSAAGTRAGSARPRGTPPRRAT